MLPWFNHVAKVRIFSLPPNVYSNFKTFSMSSLLLMRYVWPLTSMKPYLAKAHTVGGQPSSPRSSPSSMSRNQSGVVVRFSPFWKSADNHNLCHSMLQMSVVRYWKLFSTFVESSNWRYILESVFYAFVENVVVFFAEGSGQHSFLVYSIVTGALRPDVSHIYRVWGIGTFTWFEVATTYHMVNEISLTLFFFITD